MSETAAEVSSPDHHLAESTQGISASLNEAGHPQTPKQVLAGSEANEVLAKLEDGGTAEVIEDAGNVVGQTIENIRGDIAGSTRHYSVRGEKGHEIFHGKISKRVLRKGMAEKIHNILRMKIWK